MIGQGRGASFPTGTLTDPSRHPAAHQPARGPINVAEGFTETPQKTTNELHLTTVICILGLASQSPDFRGNSQSNLSWPRLGNPLGEKLMKHFF